MITQVRYGSRYGSRVGGSLMSDALRRIDDLVDHNPVLPPPHIRQRLRLAAGLTQAQVAEAIGVRVLAVKTWESGKAVPRQPHRDAYAHFLQRLAEKFPEVADAG
ncbi:helix-turn-helix domain-containing protein [Streptomyces sp. NPDC056883]|uniref:helix-turn-helix domain-containing protein n=1 Tax=Streptomyces sp. NPDC056883 TaxID=3345959 RepID=UPI003697192E